MIFRWHSAPNNETRPPLHLRLLGWCFPGRQIILVKLTDTPDGLWTTHVEMLVHDGEAANCLAASIEALSTALQNIDPSRVRVEMVD